MNPETQKMFTHTKGPWIVDEVNTANGKGYFINHIWVDEAEVAHVDEIAEVQMDYYGVTALCNACLLAAAPEMLEALREVRSCTDAVLRMTDKAKELMDAAIAKADELFIELDA